MEISTLQKKEMLTEQFNFRLTPFQKEKLEDLSNEYQLSTGYIARVALSDWLEAHSEIDE